MKTVDANILIYVHDPRDPRKQEKAIGIMGSLRGGILLWQTAAEYLKNADKLKSFGFDRSQALANIQDLISILRFVPPSPDVLTRGVRLLRTRSISYWDALIVAACLEAGVHTLYSEDINPGGRVDGLEIVNPFAA